MNGWVYICSEPRLYTVGFYSPDGKWNPESDYDTVENAARRIHYLNGGQVSACSINQDLLRASGVFSFLIPAEWEDDQKIGQIRGTTIYAGEIRRLNAAITKVRDFNL